MNSNGSAVYSGTTGARLKSSGLAHAAGITVMWIGAVTTFGAGASQTAPRFCVRATVGDMNWRR